VSDIWAYEFSFKKSFKERVKMCLISEDKESFYDLSKNIRKLQSPHALAVTQPYL